MTQVIEAWSARPSDRLGFKRKGSYGHYADLKATCARAGRMDLWKRLIAQQDARGFGYSITVLCKLSLQITRGHVTAVEAWIEAAEARRSPRISAARRLHNARCQGAKVASGKRRNPELELPDPLAHMGEIES